MGNSLLKCFRGECFGEEPTHAHTYSTPQPPIHYGLSVFNRDVYAFGLTSQAPEALSAYVDASKKEQANWYRKLNEAWTVTVTKPDTPEAAAAFVVRVLQKHRKSIVEKLLEFYDFPCPTTRPETYSLPPGVKFQFNTLPVDGNAVTDGDGINVYVDTADPRESADVPVEVHDAAINRRKARAAKNKNEVKRCNECIKREGYRVIAGEDGEEILAKKHRIRLRGIDAPESLQPHGEEAKNELAKLVDGKRLKIHFYNYDQFARLVADVYCNGVFVQEYMLRRGHAWHFEKYDKRPEFAKWQEEARAARRGLWRSSEPEKPWEWRKRNDGWRKGNKVIEETPAESKECIVQ